MLRIKTNLLCLKVEKEHDGVTTIKGPSFIACQVQVDGASEIREGLEIFCRELQNFIEMRRGETGTAASPEGCFFWALRISGEKRACRGRTQSAVPERKVLKKRITPWRRSLTGGNKGMTNSEFSLFETHRDGNCPVVHW